MGARAYHREIRQKTARDIVSDLELAVCDLQHVRRGIVRGTGEYSSELRARVAAMRAELKRRGLSRAAVESLRVTSGGPRIY